MEGNDELNYRETGTTLFSNPSFSWRRIKIGQLDVRDGTNESAVRGGALHYQGSGQVSSPCRNRTIFWRHDDHSLWLLEMSLDHALVNNTLRITLSSSHGPLQGVTLYELASHLVILFHTSSYVFRLVLPHPDVIAKDSALSAAGKGLPPSVLTFAREDSFTGTNMAVAFPSPEQHPSQVVTCSSSWIGMDGVALFVYGLSTGGIHCVRLPPPGPTGIPERFELNNKSIVTKFWNLLPAGIRGEDDVGASPVGVTLHSFSGELIIMGLSRNGVLKLWSPQQNECVMEHSLLQYIPNNVTLDDAKLSIHKSRTTSTECLHFAVYFGLHDAPQLSIFQVILVDSQLVLDLIISHSLPTRQFFVDLSLSPQEWWMACTSEESTVITHCCFTDRINPSMKNAVTNPLPLTDVIVGETKDPRETYLDLIFSIDKFSPEAIIRALKLYGSSVDRGLTVDKLRDEVIARIEEEIVSATLSCEMSHDDYRELVVKCWNKFYTCCLQYEKLVRTPVGVSSDPGTGMVTVVGQGTLVFLHPRRGITPDGSGDCLPRAREFLHQHISKELCEAYLEELSHTDPLSLVEEVMRELIHGNQSNDFVTGLLQILSESTSTMFTDLLQGLCPVPDPDSHSSEGVGVDISIADLFSSSLSTRLVGGALGDIARERMSTCRDMLVILSVMKQFGTKGTISVNEVCGLLLRFSTLLTNYHIINWLCTKVTTPNNQSTIDANLRMMSNLRITENIPVGYSMRRDVHTCTLMEVFISTYGRGLVMKRLLEASPFKPNSPVYAYWRDMLPWILDQLIKYCWPEDMFITLYQSLLAEGHYFLMQELHNKLTHLQSVSNGCLLTHSRQFLLAQSYIGTGEDNKALECFVRASGGIQTEPLLLRVSENTGGYWTVCMRLLEEAGSREGVVSLLEHATSVLDEKDDVLPLLWSNLFKYSLQLELHQKAYYAMMNNPDPERSRECLKHFVVVLTERKLIRELCNYTYCGMEEEVEHVMELRARSVEVDDPHHYYDLMYCYYISREKYWKAAHIMYEYGLRCGLEGNSVNHLKQECNSYASCLTCLKIVKPKYHWIVIPDEQTGEQSKGVKILNLQDIKRKFELVQSKVALLKRFPVLSSQLCNPYVTCEEVQTLLCQNGMFDEALKLSMSCNLSLVPVYESLAAKCAVLGLNVLTLSNNSSLWEWLSYNDQCFDTAAIAESRTSSIVDQSWNMLHEYLKRFPGDYKLLKAVTNKLLSLGCSLPQWLVDLVKITNPDGLLRLYLLYDLIPQAVELTIEYIEGVTGQGSQHFGIKNALHVVSPPVWLPYTAIDQLLNILDRYAGSDSSIAKLKDGLVNKLDEYSGLLENICQQTRQVPLLS